MIAETHTPKYIATKLVDTLREASDLADRLRAAARLSAALAVKLRDGQTPDAFFASLHDECLEMAASITDAAPELVVPATEGGAK